MRSLLWSLCLVVVGCRSMPKDDDANIATISDEGLSADNDGDGLSGADDCDDLDPSVFAGAEEICDGIDNDCDGSIDEGVRVTYYQDADADGFGDPTIPIEACEPPDGVSLTNTDCDDTRDDVYPGAVELCNGIDDNCDGVFDDASEVEFYLDSDGDGHGDPSVSASGCAVTDGYVALNDDCDDANADVFPGATETCNERDDDCDLEVDEGVRSTYYADADLDGYGNLAAVTESCVVPPGYAETAGDCVDTDSAIHPGATEVCNGFDDNCDALVDDDDPALDAASRARFYADGDSDGYGSSLSAVDACDAPVGYVGDATDCDDAAAAVHPGAPEVCNGIDDDCNALVDEDDPTLDASTRSRYYADADADGYGAATSSVDACTPPSGHTTDSTDCDDTSAAIHPGATEICNGVDDDCDILVDDDDPGLDTATASVWYDDADLDGFGDAASGSWACTAPAGAVNDDSDCDDSDADVNPAATEMCDGIDEDCSGSLDWWEQDADADGWLACETVRWMHTDSAINNDPTSTGLYGSSSAAGLLTSYGTTIGRTRLATSGLTRAQLDDVGLLVVVGTSSDGPLSATQSADLEAWVADGGRVVWVGYHATTAGCSMVDSLPVAWGITCNQSAATAAWSAPATSFASHPVTAGVADVVGLGGEQWSVSSPASVVIDASGVPVVSVVEWGDGRVVAVADEWMFYNAGSGAADISYGDHEILIDNIWAWAVDWL